MTSGSSGRTLVFSQPLDDLLARPVMIVVEMKDDRVQRQPLVAADRTAPPDIFEAIEQAVETRTNGLHLARQRIRAFVCRAERARSSIVGEVRAEGLRSALRAGSNRFGELELILARYLVHHTLRHPHFTPR